MQTYSLLIAWSNDEEEGNFAWTGRAENEEAAERLAREEMWHSWHSESQGEPLPDDIMQEFGFVQECTIGAIWKASEMEEALSDLLEWAEQTGGWEAPCWTRARALLNEIRGEGITMQKVKDLERGFSLCRDDDGDFWLLPPENVTILSAPGEALLLNADNETSAEAAALTEMMEI
jgi:hypothetical protein